MLLDTMLSSSSSTSSYSETSTPSVAKDYVASLSSFLNFRVRLGLGWGVCEKACIKGWVKLVDIGSLFCFLFYRKSWTFFYLL